MKIVVLPLAQEGDARAHITVFYFSFTSVPSVLFANLTAAFRQTQSNHLMDVLLQLKDIYQKLSKITKRINGT